MFRGDIAFDHIKPKSITTMDEQGRGEKKRQQSRSAAKSRRLTESEIFTQLIDTLPRIDQSTIYQMDRIGALRLAWTLCRIRRVGERFFGQENENELSMHKSKFMPNLLDQQSMDACVDGFLIVVNKVGQLLYLTPSVAESIGFTQIDLVGRYLRDYVHSDDWNELREHLCKVDGTSVRSDQDEADIATKTFFRMKTALTPRGGRARKLTMAVYQPLQVHIVKPFSITHKSTLEGFDYDDLTTNPTSATEDEDIRLMHCIPFTLSSSRRSSTELLQSITSRHDLDMRFRICDEIFAQSLGYKNAKAFIGRSFYEFIHPDDVQFVVRDVQSMYRKSHSRTGYYRLLNRLGESIWVMSEMLLLVQNVRGSSQKSVVCTHQILSESQTGTMDLPRTIIRECLQPIDEEQFEDNSDEDDCAPDLLDETESLPRLATSTIPMQMDVVIPLALMNPFDGTTDLCPEEHSKSLAPYIPCESQMLTPLDGPDSMPGLLPVYWDNWLSGNPILSEEVVKTNPKSTSTETQVQIFENPSAQILPLDFVDIFGMNIEDSDQFSVDEFERAFSQFDDQSPNTPQVEALYPSTPINVTPVVHSDWLPASSYSVVPIVQNKSTTGLQRQQSKSNDIFFDQLDKSVLNGPSGSRHHRHHYTRAEEKQIDNIEKELFLETQRFLI